MCGRRGRRTAVPAGCRVTIGGPRCSIRAMRPRPFTPLFRSLAGLGVALCLAPVVGLASRQAAAPRPVTGPRFEIRFSADARKEAVTGRVYVAISKVNTRAADRSDEPDGRAAVCRQRREPRAGSGGRHRREHVRLSGARPARHPGRRLLGAAVRQRLHEVRARRRPHGVAAHGPVGGPELEAIARQHLGHARAGAFRSGVVRRRSRSSRTRSFRRFRHRWTPTQPSSSSSKARF